MRLQLFGSYTLEEFQAVITLLTETLQANGIDSLRYINFYFQTCSDRSQVEFSNDGKKVDHLVFENGILKQNETNSADLKLVKAYEFNTNPRQNQ